MSNLKTIRLFIMLLVCPCMLFAKSQLTISSQTQEQAYLQERSHFQERSSSKDIFLQANQLLEQANQFEKQARALILTANKTRKAIAVLRAKSRKEKQPKQKNSMLSQADEQAITLENQQKEGAKLRVDSLLLRAQAMQFFEQGMVSQWDKWVNNRAPLTMDEKTINFLAHNTQIRSVHPTMLNKMGAVGGDPKAVQSKKNNQSMTLQIAALVSQNAPPNLNINAFQLSNNQHYLAHIEVNDTSGLEVNNISQIPLNQMHQWHLILSDKKGSPVTNANIEVLGHMPGHVHGLPTQPMVTKEIDDGVYLVEGLKFQMQGWWVIKFNVSSKNIPDTLTFNLVL